MIDGIIAAIHIRDKGIWIPLIGRPYWTHQNKKGNAGPHLTDAELIENDLAGFLNEPFSVVWAKSWAKGNE